MSTFYPTTIDYSNRQVDVELLQHVPEPTALIQVTLALSHDTPKMVTGIAKLAQRYALLILTTVGEIQFDKNQGTYLLSSIAGARVQNRGQLQVAFASANANVLNQMRGDDSNEDLYGEIPTDEAIRTAQLLDFDIDFQQSVVYLRVYLVSRAGTSVTYVVPISAVRT